MRYTVAIVVEKALELLGMKALKAQYGEGCAINGFSTSRDQRRGDILWINDNSGGQRPYAQSAARHCMHIASRSEEAGELPSCDGERTLVVLPHTVQIRRLVNAMEQTFAFYNAWADRLLDVVGRDADWDALAEAGHAVLNDPMILYNRSMRVLAHTAGDGTRDALWTDTVKAGTALVDTPRQSADLMKFLREVERHDEPFRHQGEGMSDPFWCAPIQVDGRRLGMVNVVEFHHPLTPGDIDLLRFFAEFVSIAMRRSDHQAPTPDAVPRQFMMDLLSGDIASRDRLNTRLIAVDWQASRYFRFVCLRSGLPFETSERWRAIYNQLAGMGLNGLSCLIGQTELHIALLLTDDAPDRMARRLKTVEQFCAMNHLRAGISDVYDDLLDTRRFYRQAEVALELKQDDVCWYEQARYARMLRHLRSHPFRKDLMHPAVVKLYALDGDSGSEYVPTLRALIRHNFNQLETAESLGIHRTTLAYRLRRIVELTGIDFDDPEQMFHAAVSLHLMSGREQG